MNILCNTQAPISPDADAKLTISNCESSSASPIVFFVEERNPTKVPTLSMDCKTAPVFFSSSVASKFSVDQRIIVSPLPSRSFSVGHNQSARLAMLRTRARTATTIWHRPADGKIHVLSMLLDGNGDHYLNIPITCLLLDYAIYTT